MNRWNSGRGKLIRSRIVQRTLNGCSIKAASFSGRRRSKTVSCALPSSIDQSVDIYVTSYQVAEHSWRGCRPTRHHTCLFCGLLRRQRRIPKFSNKARTGYVTGRL